jgi:pyridoxamine 5'-phosphate oxidase
VDVADVDPDPFVQVARWLDDVVAAGLTEPTAMVLATAGADGRSLVRSVLLKGMDRDGFVWFTNYESRKGRHLAANPYASLLFPWWTLRRQVIVTGPVLRLDADESDAYFATRDRASQLGAWASDQSQVIPNREHLEERFAVAEAGYEETDVPRPPHWGGYRLVPDAIELWAGQPNRLHDRLRYVPEGDGWRIERLAP